MRVITKVAVGLLVATSTAAAGPFVHIQRFDGISTVGADLSYFKLDSDANDLTLMRFDLHGHYVDPASNLGAYLQVPIGYASGNNESETALGDVEVGGIYVPPSLTTLDRTLVLHAGLTLPTASDDLATAIVAGYSSFARVHDLYQAIPKGMSLRFGASPHFRSGNLFLQADFGFDINLDAAGDETADPAMHFNVGVGVRVTPDVSLTGEIASLTVFDDQDGDDDNVINGGIGARFQAGTLSPYLGLVVPLDDDLSDFFDFAVVLGLDARI